jgi:pimeloyl-ACP methyl ester carboxylesterase
MRSLLLLLLFAAASAFGQSGVGFISITRFDKSRPPIEEQGDKEHGRILQINMWYPTAEGKKLAAEKMCFGDYVGLAGLELDSSLVKDWYNLGVNRYFAWPESAKANRQEFLEFLQRKEPMKAIKNAARHKQKYPLIMLVHGYAADHAFLAEKIAEKGFVVMQVPVKGTLRSELDYEDRGLESQVLDYEFGLKILQEEFQMETDAIGVAGFSFGGQSAIALAIRNGQVKAVASLDGGIGSAFGARLLESQSYYDTKKLSQPILHLYNARDPYTDLKWLKTAPRSQRFLVSMKNMEHGHFTSFGMLNEWLPGIMGENAPDPGAGYDAVITLTADFFHTSIKNAAPVRNDFITEEIKNNPFLKSVIINSEIIS